MGMSRVQKLTAYSLKFYRRTLIVVTYLNPASETLFLCQIAGQQSKATKRVISYDKSMTGTYWALFLFLKSSLGKKNKKWKFRTEFCFLFHLETKQSFLFKESYHILIYKNVRTDWICININRHLWKEHRVLKSVDIYASTF